HADPHIEDLVEFRLRDAAVVLEKPENRRQRPGTFPDNNVAVLGQHAGDVIHEAAAGDVSQTPDDRAGVKAPEQGQDQRSIADVYFEQFVAQRIPQLRHVSPGFPFQLLEEDLSSEGIAVRVQPGGSDADDRVAGTDSPAIENFRFFDNADYGSADVVLTGPVEPGHLRGLAADERAAVLRAGQGKAFDDVIEDARFELPGAGVIEKKERLGAEHGDVVHAMIDKVL